MLYIHQPNLERSKLEESAVATNPSPEWKNDFLPRNKKVMIKNRLELLILEKWFFISLKCMCVGLGQIYT